MARLTLGLMMIPQGLSYARIATVPVQYGLMASWLPSTIYAFMGTTKGPTSLISLLTAEIIEQLRGESWSAFEIASAVAMMIGIYGMAIGLFKLGFLLELISRPILSGFVSAVAIMIILNQLDSLLGEPSKWGGKHKLVWFLSITRAFIALLIFTGVGYAVNKPRGSPDRYLFPVAQVEASGLETPRVPQAKLLSRVASGSITVFIGSAVEHTAIARGFGARNNYEADQSQELTFYGVANIANSFFHAVGVGGAMSRTAVNSSCHVKSPLSGLVTTAVVLVSIFKLVGTLYWIPKATLAAVIVTAVWPLISVPSVFYRYWRTSLADFISSMIAFWVSLFVSTSMGIAGSVGFNLAYVLLRQVFTRVSVISDHRSELAIALDEARNIPATIPLDTRVFRFNDSLFFLNGYRVKTSVLEVIKTFHAPGPVVSRPERNWSVKAEKRLEKLRHSAGITGSDALPRLELVVLDFGKVNHIDTTALRLEKKEEKYKNKRG
ncbi:hypothetical protein N0V88_007868 [Collariella sp. IMI 366227]|nr:hypothetical protein N0V88_007868 [Collariella sp. IMI 366227]